MVIIDPAQLVGAGGALGALLRYWVTDRLPADRFPVGTLTVNVLGSFALGVLTFLGADSELVLFLGTGACGSFTTYSSFAFETVRLWETGDRPAAIGNAFGNLIGAGIALGVAWVVARGFLLA
ncbi:MAG: fluoride efflux transporter CrcB [Halobacteriales archaeon]|nr:fluoride efflux transporter CrcB [Halobacteriales archaeon]